MDLTTPLTQVSGIGSTMANRLTRLNLLCVEDLIHHYPFRYDDFSNVENALEAQVGEKVTITGEIWSIKNIYTRSRKILTQAIFNDGNAPITLTWFNSPWLTKNIQTGDRLQISGKLSKYKDKLSVVAPQWKKILDSHQSSVVSHQTGQSINLIPIYPETYGVTSKWLNTKISQILPQVFEKIHDPLPEKIKNGMLPLKDALDKIHFPKDLQEATLSRERLAFDELFYIQLATLKTRLSWQQKSSVDKFEINQKYLNSFIKNISFKLTAAQERVLSEILGDLKKGIPMNRLVQGEVGSGKTIVAAIIAYMTHLNGFKTLFMAPTEILAFQHYETLTHLLEPFGIRVGIYTGSKKQLYPIVIPSKARNLKIKSRDSSPAMPDQDDKKEPDVIIGTHALLSSKLATPDIGLVIVDEQQRFGVEQRSLLRSRAKIPHFLTMTATPIPRTVALTMYGDLDMSVIDEMPKGRKKVKTYVVPGKKRLDAYKFLEKKVRGGGQVFIITPLIEQSETLQSAKAAKVEYERLKKDVFPNLKLGLLHGRLPSKEKEAVIKAFRDGQTDILVSTSVVEVGMDIPNATIMVIEGAERFGLAQLHQLRGRVGRGDKESFCFLFAEDQKATSRLKNLEKIYDGLKLAELDLKIRGGGEIFGKKQSGRFEFKLASLSDLTLIEKTRTAAHQILKEDSTLDKHPSLEAKLRELSSLASPD